MVDASPSAIVKGGSEDEHVVPVIRVVGELLTLRRQLIGKPPDQALLIHFEIRNQARALVAGKVLVSPLMRSGKDYEEWALAKKELEESDRKFAAVRIPQFAIPNAHPTRGPWGTTYTFEAGARESFGSMDAEHVPYILPGRLERHDKMALLKPIMDMEGVEGHLFVALALLHIIDENTAIALRLSEWTPGDFKRDVASAQGVLPAGQPEMRPPDDGDDYDEDRYGVIEDI